MSVKVKTKVLFDPRRIVEKYKKTHDLVNKKTAKTGAVMASSFFAGQYRGVDRFKHTEHVMSSFRAQRSIRKDHGWIFGPFASGGGEWTETVGGRSFFFEYGRMPPGRGRAGARAEGLGSTWINIDSEGQPARPFMTPTRDIMRPRHRSNTEKAFDRMTTELNKKYKSINR